jgi:4-hydroxy-2-oxoheptanedioate aldolase
MRTRLRDAWNAGNAGINAWLSMPNTVSAEITARQDFDSITIDLQHGLNDYLSALAMLQALEPGTATPMARVPWLEPGIIMKVLDAGALGIICPMVNTPQDAEALVHYAHYAPRGTRSFGPTRAILAYGGDYPTRANDAVVTLAMIETAQALENVDAIVATPDLTGVYIGPSDLSLSMGRTPKLDQDDAEVVAAIDAILGAAKKAGVRAGIHCISTDYARQMIAKGFDLVTVGGSDIRIYAAALAERVAAMRD